MNRVQSKDGTSIAFDRSGEGQVIVMVGGGSVDRMANAPLAALLTEHFTVFNYDRRGRGDSGDTAPYAVDARSRISMPSSTKPVDRHPCTARPPVRL